MTVGTTRQNEPDHDIINKTDFLKTSHLVDVLIKYDFRTKSFVRTVWQLSWLPLFCWHVDNLWVQIRAGIKNSQNSSDTRTWQWPSVSSLNGIWGFRYPLKHHVQMIKRVLRKEPLFFYREYFIYHKLQMYKDFIGLDDVAGCRYAGGWWMHIVGCWICISNFLLLLLILSTISHLIVHNSCLFFTQ